MSAQPFLSSSWYRVASLRPRLREHVVVGRHRYRGSVWYVLHDHATGQVHRLAPASYVMVAAMDGSRTVDQLWDEAMVKLGQEAPSQAETIHFLAQLHAADLLQTEIAPNSAELLERAERRGRGGWLQNLLNPLAMRVSLWHPDKFFERTVPFVGWLMGWPGAVLWLVTVLPAIVLAIEHWPELSANATDHILAADNVLMIGLSYIVLKTLHELGHGYAVKAFGGPVHEFGVMFLVFAPMPYVDASAASEFRSKWRRAVVGAAGMIVELFFAALALYVWLAVEHGFVHALAYNAMLVSGVSTVVFNGNPLLRYDGYYILSDVLEIPNLAQRSTRYWGYLVDRYVFWTEGVTEFAATAGEKAWLLAYSPASCLYRIAVMFAIATFMAAQYLAVGVAIAVWGLAVGIGLPMVRALARVVASPRLQRNRVRAVTVTFGFALLLLVTLFAFPAPHWTTTEGVVWLPESAIVRAGTSGFIRRLLVEPGRFVTAGEALVEGEEPTLATVLENLRARVAELEARLAAERFNDRVSAEITTTELRQARAELASETGRAERLVVRSRAEGMFAVAKPQDLPGRYYREGQEIGYVLPASFHLVRATVRQDDIDLVRNRLRKTMVKLAERVDETWPAHIIREVPAGRDELPSKALGAPGGGALPVDPRDPQGKRTFERFFQVDLALPADAASAVVFGGRAYVRFDHDWEPVGQQIWRRTRQLLLARLNA